MVVASGFGKRVDYDAYSGVIENADDASFGEFVRGSDEKVVGVQMRWWIAVASFLWFG